MILLGIRDREMRTPRDLNKAPLVNSVNRDISIPRVAIKVRTFKRFRVSGWGRYTLNPASEIGGYTSREGIS